MIVWIAIAFVIGFCSGGMYALYQVKTLRLRWHQKAQARARSMRTALEQEEAEGDGDVIIPCGPICQECRAEGYPDWLCALLA